MPERESIARRSFLRGLAAGGAAACALPWLGWMAAHGSELKRQGMSCILLWMQGGASQFETFDPKPEHAHGGPTGVIRTQADGIRIAEHWPRVAQTMRDICLIRSMTNREGNHQRATYQLLTGYVPSAGIKHPSLGAAVANELADRESALPSYVVLGGRRRQRLPGAGILGADYEPFFPGAPGKVPSNTELNVSRPRFERRLGLLDRLEKERTGASQQAWVDEHASLYGRASRLVLSPRLKAFDLADEPESMRAAYGDTPFAKQCLLARRLVEAGVTFVQVVSPGWDTHAENFDRVKELSAGVDHGFAQLVEDLRQRGRLEKTLVVWMGEFGRTPRINARAGRDHFPRAFTVALAGGGVRGGQAIGATSADGMEIKDRPVSVPDLFCTICQGLGVDPRNENNGPLGRPIKVVEGGAAIPGVFA